MAPSSGRLEQELLVPLVALLLFTQFHRGGTFSLLSRGQLYIMDAGESIQLECEFHTLNFDLFTNPVLWIKTQYQEENRINYMGNINEPFLSTGRFNTKFHPTPPRYRMVLSIKALSLEDSGNYTCEVRGKENAVLAIITHRLFIRAPIQDIILSKDNCTKKCDFTTPTSLSFNENDPSPLQCVAAGGNPPPEIKVFLDHIDISYRFKSETYTRLLGDEGLRIMHSSVHLTTNYLVLEAKDDGLLLRCTAAVPGLRVNSTSSKVHVSFAPVIRCESKSADVGDKNVKVSCRIRSRPRASASTVFWMLDDNGTSVTETDGPVDGQYWTLSHDQPNSDSILLVELYLRKIDMDSFRKYTLVVVHMLGTKKKDVELIQNEYKTEYYGGPSKTDAIQRPAFIIVGNTASHLAYRYMVLLVAFQVIHYVLLN